MIFYHLLNLLWVQFLSLVKNLMIHFLGKVHLRLLLPVFVIITYNYCMKMMTHHRLPIIQRMTRYVNSFLFHLIMRIFKHTY